MEQNAAPVLPRVSRFEHRPKIDIQYGEKTWRPVQSVIDVIQNHLDAETIKRDKKILGLNGNGNGKNGVQEGQTTEHHPQVSSEIVPYTKPNLQLKMRLGETVQFVPYDQVRDMPNVWEIIGYRVEDSGSGFDDELLGMVGASTKDETQRGGLGEGLKMSVTHLVRAGISVRLVSRNKDNLWIAHPKVTDGEVSFTGIRKSEHNDQTGSLTDVDFSGTNVEARTREVIRMSLDPRVGEGVGKYVLEFRDDTYLPITDTSQVLSLEDIPPGRAYVKGLLIEEQLNLLFSYNLGQKWAIGGRDRKTVKKDILEEEMKRGIEKASSEQTNVIVSALVSGGNQNELKLIKPSLQVDHEHEQIWKDALRQSAHFEVGKTLFTTGTVSDQNLRLIQEAGYQLTVIPAEYMQAITFFEHLYGNELVSARQFLAKRAGKDEYVEIRDTPVNPEVAHSLMNLKTEYLVMLLNHLDAIQIPLNFANLESLQFAVATKEPGDAESSFEYSQERNVIYVHDTDLTTYASRVDFFAELTKTAVSTEVFDNKTQQLLTELVGASILSAAPQLREQYIPFVPEQKIELDRTTYTDAQKDRDRIAHEDYHYLSILGKPNASRDEVEAALSNIRDLRHRGRYNSIFYYNGQLFQINKYSETWRTLEEMEGTILKDANTFSLEGNQTYYYPFELEENQSLYITVKDNQEVSYLQVRRVGGQIITTRTDDSGTIVVPSNERESFSQAASYFDCFETNANVMYFHPTKQREIQITKNNPHVGEQLLENHQGETFIEGNITINYGEQVWNNPKRILLDAMQNHIDASGGLQPNIVYTVCHHDGSIRRVSQQELQTMEQEWNIVGMEITDEGDGYPTPYLTRLGASTKSDEDIGAYGEGLKMFAAAGVRLGIPVQLASRDWEATPRSYEKTIKDYANDEERTFAMLGYDMTWTEQKRVGSATRFSILPPSITQDQEHLGDAQIAEVYARLDRQSAVGLTWSEWISIMDPRLTDHNNRHGLERFIAPRDTSSSTSGAVRLLYEDAGNIYEKSLLIPSGEPSRALFGYDINARIINTRERDTYDPKLLNEYIKNYYLTIKDKNALKTILQRAADSPKSDFLENRLFKDMRLFEISEETLLIWKEAFHEVFGDDAILSLKSIPIDEAHGGEPGNHDKLSSQKRAVTNEIHLENHNLVHLPGPITKILQKAEVYDSLAFLQQFEAASITLPPTQRYQLITFLQSINQTLAQMIDSMESDPQQAHALRGVINKDSLATQKELLLAMDDNGVAVKARSFPVNGLVSKEQNKLLVSINEKILPYIEQLTETYGHEAIHILSQHGDYNLNFQRFLLFIALHGNKHAQISQQMTSLERIQQRTQIERTITQNIHQAVQRCMNIELPLSDRGNGWRDALQLIGTKEVIRQQIRKDLKSSEAITNNEMIYSNSSDEHWLQRTSYALASSVTQKTSYDRACYAIATYFVQPRYHNLTPEQVAALARAFPNRGAQESFEQYKARVEQVPPDGIVPGRGADENWVMRREILDILEIADNIERDQLSRAYGQSISLRNLIKTSSQALSMVHRLATQSGVYEVDQSDKMMLTEQ